VKNYSLHGAKIIFSELKSHIFKLFLTQSKPKSRKFKIIEEPGKKTKYSAIITKF